MSPKFEVVIPVVNPDLANVLIKNMEENTLLPERVVIINNSNESYMPRSTKFLIEIYFSKTGLVNESINLGISETTDCDFVSILNDDIQIGFWFFKRIAKVFNEMRCCASLPHIIVDPKKLPLKDGPYSPSRMAKVQGCAMSFRKEVINQIPEIPAHRIKTFHGDDWLWMWSIKQTRLRWFTDSGNPIYHMVGQSTLKLGKRRQKKRERNEWEKILWELNG